MGRAYSFEHIRQYRPEVMALSGPFAGLIGSLERTGSWIVWGNSGSGKTRFTLQLARYARVCYDSLKEGLSLTMKQAIEGVGMADVKRSFMLLDREPIAELREWLEKRNRPRVVMVDSL